jgi:FkbM family methyltransferase
MSSSLIRPLRRAAGRVWREIRPTLEVERRRWLQRYIPTKRGFFVEAGAFDGIIQNNTVELEHQGWRGLLIEPVPAIAERCRHNRPLATVEECALVPPDYDSDRIQLTYCGLMTVARGALKSSEADAAHIESAKEHMGADKNVFEFEARARTLTQVFDAHKVPQIDLLCLDIEGLEAPVLRGLDLERYAPKFMLIEARFRSDVEGIIGARYEAIGEIGPMDVLYRLKVKSAKSDH